MQDSDSMDEMSDETNLTEDELAVMWDASEPAEVARRPPGSGQSTTASSPPRATFEIYMDRAGKFWWRLVADDGSVIADSQEGYPTKAAVLRSIDVLRQTVNSAPAQLAS